MSIKDVTIVELVTPLKGIPCMQGGKRDCRDMPPGRYEVDRYAYARGNMNTMMWDVNCDGGYDDTIWYVPRHMMPHLLRGEDANIRPLY